MKHAQTARRAGRQFRFRSFIAGVASFLLVVFTLFQNGGRVVEADTNIDSVAVGTNPTSIGVNPITNKIYVVSSNGTTDMTVIDGTNNTTATVPIGSGATSVAVNPATNKIYVACLNSFTVKVIDGTTNSVTTLTLNAAPRNIAINPVTNKIYVTYDASQLLTIIDGVTNGIITVPTPNFGRAIAVNPVTNRIYVANFVSDNLTVFDGISNLQIALLPTGDQPTALAINPVTNKIYVANTSSDTVTVIDGSNNAVTNVGVGGAPRFIAVNPVTNKIYAADQGSGDVTVIDGANNSTITVPAGVSPSSVGVNSITNKIYVANFSSDDVTIIDGTNNSTTTVGAGAAPGALAIDPITNRIYVANAGSANVTVIDGSYNTTTNLAAGSGAQPVAIAVNPVTNKIYSANQFSNTVTVIDGTNNSTTILTAGVSPVAIAVNPVTNKIYVVNQNSSNVTVIDGATNSTTGVPVGSIPFAIAVNPVTNKIYVANLGSSDVTVITGSNNSTATVAVGTSPRAVAVNPVTNKIYVANQDSQNATVIDGSDNSTTAVATGSFPVAVAVNPLTNKIYVGNNSSANVTAIDGTNNATTNIPVGISPFTIALNAVTNRIYVGSLTTAEVAIIDGVNNSTTTLSTGSGPRAFAVNAATNKIYVANQNSGTVTAIDGTTNESTTTITAGTFPHDVAVNPITNKVYVANRDNSTITVVTPAPATDGSPNTAITPLVGNTTNNPTPTFTLSALAVTGPAPQHIYFQMDSTNGVWTRAVNDAERSTAAARPGVTLTATATTTPLQTGVHIIYFFATDGSEATSINPFSGKTGAKNSRIPLGALRPGASPVTGGVNAYMFLISASGPGGPCSPTAISFGQSISGLLDATSCVSDGNFADSYTFTSTGGGQQIAITLDSSDFSSKIELVNAQSEVIAQAGGLGGHGNSRLPASGYFTLPSTGTYTIRAIADFDGDGLYTISLYEPVEMTCSYILSSEQTNVPSGGGTFSFDVIKDPLCPPGDPPSFSGAIYSSAEYQGGRVTFAVAANPGAAPRQDTITVAGQTHTINQYGLAPPSNDNFAAAQVISGINSPPGAPVTGYNTTATGEPGEPTHAGNAASHSVWYSWTSPENGLYSFSTSGSSFDTVMEIYACPQGGGCTFGTMTAVGANDDTTSFDTTSKVNFRANAGTQYLIAVDGKNGATGTIQLTWRQYQRLFRLYLQNYNGRQSTFTPDSITASNGTNTVTPLIVSQGVYEFNLPADNTTYIVTIAGPTGIVWDPNNFPLDTSFSRLDELMQGPEDGGQNNTSNAGNETPRYIFGYIRNITSQEIGSLSVLIGSSRGPNPRDAAACSPLNPTVVGGVQFATYQCLTQPQTLHDIIPAMAGKNFTIAVKSYDHPIENDEFGLPSTAFVASNTPTYSISGHVTAGGSGTVVDLTYTPVGNTEAISQRTTTDATGFYEFRNLAANTYTLKAAHEGFVFNAPGAINLTADQTVDITAQFSCTYTATTVDPLPSDGGAGQFTITTNDGTCTWAAQSQAPWLVINSSATVGTGPVHFTADANTGPARTGVITAGGQDVVIEQAAACTYSLSPPVQANFPASGGSSSFTVTTPSTCSWVPETSDYCMVGVVGGVAGSGTVNFTITSNGGVARSATITVGGQTITVTQDAAPGTHRARFDFDGDGRSDLAVYRPLGGFWYFQNSTSGFGAVPFGVAEDIPVAADYDGDGRTDIAVLRPSTNFWYQLDSSNGQFHQTEFGGAGDVPVPADYDGDGHDNIAVFRPSSGTWYTSTDPNTNYGAVQWGTAGDVPAQADYDGDDHVDVAVFRPSDGIWYLNQSTAGFYAVQFGAVGDIPVAADYDGDGKADIAVYRPSTSIWYRINSSDGQFVAFQFGLPGDRPVPADYNGDSKTDIAVFRPSNGGWYAWSCTNNPSIFAALFGVTTDKPVHYPVVP